MTATFVPANSDRRTDGPTLRRIVASELIKIRSLRSLIMLLAIGAAFTLALGPIEAIGQIVEEDAAPLPDTGAALSLVMTGITSAVILFGVLGVLSATSEFAHGSISITLTAVPRRASLVVGKALGLVATLAPAVLLSVVIAFEVGRRVLAEDGYALGWTDPGAMRVLLASILYLVGWALLGQALGWMLKSSVGASFALLGVMFVLPLLTLVLPDHAVQPVQRLLPSDVAMAMLLTDDSGALTPGVAAVVWIAYLLLGTATAASVVSRRDA